MNDKNDFIIKGEYVISLLQAIIISILFLKMYYVNSYNEGIIREYIYKLKSMLPVFEFYRLDIILSNIERNYKEESNTFWRIVFEKRTLDNITTYKSYLESYCISKDLVSSLTKNLDYNDNNQETKYELNNKGVILWKK